MVKQNALKVLKAVWGTGFGCMLLISILLIANKSYFGQDALLPIYAGIMAASLLAVTIEAVIKKEVICRGFSFSKSEKPFWYYTLLVTYSSVVVMFICMIVTLLSK